jgi:hypothetical protein
MNWFKSLWGGAANLGGSDNETIQQRIRRRVERRGGTPAVWFAPEGRLDGVAKELRRALSRLEK